MVLTLNEKIFITFIWMMLLGFLVCMGIIDHSFGSLFDNLDGPISCGSPEGPVSSCVSCITSRTGCTIDLCDIKNMKVATKVALWTSVIAFILYSGMLVWYYMATKGTVGGSTPASGGPTVDYKIKFEQAEAQRKSFESAKDEANKQLAIVRAEKEVWQQAAKSGSQSQTEKKTSPLR